MWIIFEEEKRIITQLDNYVGKHLPFVVKAGAEENGEGEKEKRTPQSPPKFNQ